MTIEYGGPVVDLPLVAGESLTSDQYKLMKLNGSGQAIKCTATTDKPIGVLQNNPASGAGATVRAFGPTKVDADASLAIDDLFGTSADAQAAPYVAGTDTTKYLVGRIIKAAGAAGRKASALVNCMSLARGA